MKCTITDGNGVSYEISAENESEIYNLLKELIKAQTEKTLAEAKKLDLEARTKEQEINNEKLARLNKRSRLVEHRGGLCYDR